MKRLTFKKYQNCNNRYFVVNKENEKLGDIYFYNNWRKYVFESEIGIIFSWDCLKEISNFIKNSIKRV